MRLKSKINTILFLIIQYGNNSIIYGATISTQEHAQEYRKNIHEWDIGVGQSRQHILSATGQTIMGRNV